MGQKINHSVLLQPDMCKGCTHCLKRCPTEAIRIRNGKAVIREERCIDCGECIRRCPYQAKKALYDSFEDFKDYKWKIALPAPALYGQFDNLDDLDYVVTGLKKCGFDDVFEVARAAVIVSDYTRQYLARTDIRKPVISSACPVVVRLISVRFPYLIDNKFPTPCYQCVVIENGKVFTCGRCIDVPGLCEQCGYFFVAEYTLLFRGNIKIIFEMLRTYLKYI